MRPKISADAQVDHRRRRPGKTVLGTIEYETGARDYIAVGDSGAGSDERPRGIGSAARGGRGADFAHAHADADGKSQGDTDAGEIRTVTDGRVAFRAIAPTLRQNDRS